MAIKRTRTTSTTTVTPEVDTVINPTEKVEKENKYDSILQRLQELEEQNKTLTKKVAEANWDISEQIKNAKRRYWYNLDWTRNTDELFKYGYNTLISDRKEKVVISAYTIGRPINIKNHTTWKWENIHDLDITFQDWTKTEMDVLDYINQKVRYDDFVRDEDIQVIDGVKNYTFRTEKFWTFTIKENFTY
jgi:hypothetical protein